MSKSPTTYGQRASFHQQCSTMEHTFSTSKKVRKLKTKLYMDSQKGVMITNWVELPSSLLSSLGKDMENKGDSAIGIGLLVDDSRCEAVSTFILSITALLMFPPKARSSLGVGGLGPNSASPFFFSSSTLAAAGPLAFISFLNTKKLYTLCRTVMAWSFPPNTQEV